MWWDSVASVERLMNGPGAEAMFSTWVVVDGRSVLGHVEERLVEVTDDPEVLVPATVVTVHKDHLPTNPLAAVIEVGNATFSVLRPGEGSDDVLRELILRRTG